VNIVPPLARPELAICGDGAQLRLAAAATRWHGLVEDDGAVVVDGRLLAGGPGCLAPLHFLLELSLWRRAAPGPAAEDWAAALLAAAHATAALVGLLPAAEAAAESDATPFWLRRLMAVAVAGRCDAHTAAALAEAFAVTPAGPLLPRLDPRAAWNLFAALRPVALPAAALLRRDGDWRLQCDPATGLDRYGCAPLPRVDEIGFSSSTASTVSAVALRAAEGLRRQVMAASLRGRVEDVLAKEAAGLKLDILAALGLPEHGGIVVVPAASGTVATLLATHVGLGAGGPALVLLLGAAESGSGIALAASGRHPGGRTPRGVTVVPGAPIPGIAAAGLWLEEVAVRDGDGTPLTPDFLVKRLAERIATARAAGRRVLLHVLEGSKTGLVTPGLAAVLALKARFADGLEVIVDSCQMRGDPADLARYLAAGCMVVATGSKFYGGPPLCGVLLLPAAIADRAAPLAAGLGAYTWRSDWPPDWEARCARLPAGGNPGLLLRWHAALIELEAFARLPRPAIQRALAAFGEAVRAVVAGAPELSLVGEGSSIFTVAVAGLGLEALRRLHHLLAEDLSASLPAKADEEDRALARRHCLIGQPVAAAGALRPAGLRLAASARLVGRLCGNDGGRLPADLAIVVAKLRLIRRLFPEG